MEVLSMTLMENFAALASPRPNSFETRTLYGEEIHSTIVMEIPLYLTQEEDGQISRNTLLH